MARLNARSASTDIRSSRLSTSPSRLRQSASPTPPSSAADITSDKENQPGRSSRQGKRKSSSINMATPAPDSTTSNKRQKLSDRSQPSQSQKTRTKKLIDTNYYDPDQNPEERRAVKKNMRSLLSKLNDSRAQYLQADSTGLVDTLLEANALYKNVKQTSDATIDSRLLVGTADLAYKKVRTMTLGDSSVGIDVDDFVNKCVTFMRVGGAASQPTNTQSQRRQHQSDDDDDGDALNWAHLGRNACFLYNSRPCLSGFLLGPLSVQKKVRQQTQRRAKEARADPSQALRPIELQQKDLDKQESASLTQICAEISNLLDRTIATGTKGLEDEYEKLPKQEQEDMTHKKMLVMMRRHGMTDNGCVPLFDFCINPQSFGQTVENMFYVSFLIKEGRAGLAFDSEAMPTLGKPAAKTVAAKQEAGAQRNQAIFTLSFDVWEDLVKSFGIQKSIIPHRTEERRYDDGVIDVQAERRRESVRQTFREDDEDSDMYG